MEFDLNKIDEFIQDNNIDFLTESFYNTKEVAHITGYKQRTIKDYSLRFKIGSIFGRDYVYIKEEIVWFMMKRLQRPECFMCPYDVKICSLKDTHCGNQECIDHLNRSNNDENDVRT